MYIFHSPKNTYCKPTPLAVIINKKGVTHSLATRDKVYWHEAFFEALKLELIDYLHLLEFENEHQLSKEALIMDVLIIKKRPGEKIHKNIGQIFKGHNIIEFKSESDSLTWQDYNKVIAYALLYSAFNNILPKDITVTFALTMHPKNLLAYLEKELGFTVATHEPGIYYVIGEKFTVQILESKRLSDEQNLFVRSLRSNLNLAEANRLAHAYHRLKTFEKRNVYLDRLLQANAEIFKEMIDMDKELAATLEYITKDSVYFQECLDRRASRIAEERITKQVESRISSIAKKLLSKGLPPEDIAESTNLPLELVLQL